MSGLGFGGAPFAAHSTIEYKIYSTPGGRLECISGVRGVPGSFRFLEAHTRLLDGVCLAPPSSLPILHPPEVAN